MSSQKFLVTAVLACAAFVVVAKPSGMMLLIAKNKTICRTKVEYDVNADRIPKIIKFIKCAEDPYEMCPASNGKEMQCCGRLPLANGAKFSCTEVLDEVLVNDTTTMKGYIMNVPIGCSCIKENANKAIE